MSKKKKEIAIFSMLFRDAYDVCKFMKAMQLCPTLIMPSELYEDFMQDYTCYDELSYDIIDYINADFSDFIYLIGEELYSREGFGIEVVYMDKLDGFVMNVTKLMSKKDFRVLKNIYGSKKLNGIRMDNNIY